MGLQWQTQAPSSAHPWLWLGPHSSPFRLSPCSHPQSAPQVCPLKPEFQHPAPAHTSRHASWARECMELARTFCAGLSLFCMPRAGYCTLLRASETPFPSRLISLPVKKFPRVSEHFLFHNSLPGAQVLSRFLFFFFFHPAQLLSDLFFF